MSQSLSITSTVTADSADTEDRADSHTKASKLIAEISHKLQTERAYVAQLKQELASCKEAKRAASSADISNKDTLTFRTLKIIKIEQLLSKLGSNVSSHSFHWDTVHMQSKPQYTALSNVHPANLIMVIIISPLLTKVR